MTDTVGDRLRRAMVGVDRSKVVSDSRVSNRTIWRVLSGRSVRKGTLFSLAEALEIQPSWLILGKGAMRYEPSILPEPAPSPIPLNPSGDLFEQVAGCLWDVLEIERGRRYATPTGSAAGVLPIGLRNMAWARLIEAHFSISIPCGLEHQWASIQDAVAYVERAREQAAKGTSRDAAGRAG